MVWHTVDQGAACLHSVRNRGLSHGLEREQGCPEDGRQQRILRNLVPEVLVEEHLPFGQ